VAEVLNIEQVSLDVTFFERNGGADRDRTDDILLAKQALSQLSYSPILQGCATSRFALLLCSRCTALAPQFTQAPFY
jgi:hypothetical protein